MRHHGNTKIESGQTLVETVVAIFILTMGISAALGLANYAVSTSSNIVKQIIGMGLAREGAEAVKNMRDTNWLKDTLQTDCYDFTTATPVGGCYPGWLTQLYHLDPVVYGNQAGGADSENFNQTKSTYTLEFDANSANYWKLVNQSSNYALYFDPTNGVSGLYKTTGSGATSGYYRRISISKASTGPYSLDPDYARVLVTSEVWWNDKKCPQASPSVPPTTGNCRIAIKMYLTNWKNY